MAQLSIGDLGTVLSLWAHPDDEAYCSAGLMSAALANGQRVVCATATRGELGSTDPERWPAGPYLADVRTKELAASLAEIGVTEHRWLDYPDGGCASVEVAQAVGRVRDLIDEFQPDTILSFGPDGGTYHPDHIAVSTWISKAIEGTEIRVLHQTATPRWQAVIDDLVPRSMLMMEDKDPVIHSPEECALYLSLDGDALERKFRSLMAQESQVAPLVALGGPDVYKSILTEEAFTTRRDLA